MNRDRSGDRGQTAIDFAIAMGVFLVALTAVIGFMPTMTQPFAGAQENPLVADRLATQLVDGQLAGEQPATLDETCTLYFFNGTNHGGYCSSFDDGEPVTGKLGVSDERSVNVSLRMNVSGDASPEVVCGDGGTLVPDCSSGDRLAVGPASPRSSGSVTVARRKALLGDEMVYVVVEVWS